MLKILSLLQLDGQVAYLAILFVHSIVIFMLT